MPDISALLTVISSFVATFGGILVSSKLTTYRIEQLEKKVDQFNTISDRTIVAEEQIKTINMRLNTLENK